MLRTVKLKDVSKPIGSGITLLRSNPLFWDNGTIPWLKTAQLGEYKIYDTWEKITQYAVNQTGIKIFPANTLSIAMYGEGRTRGNVSILKTAMTTNQACCNIILDERKANYEFVYYYLKTQYRQLRSLSSGVRKNLNSNDIKEFEIRLPEDVVVQQKIASILSSLDSKIALNNRINAELEPMAKTMYDYWFVQFVFPDENGKPYRTSGGKMVWNDELKREIPEGWEAKRLESICVANTKQLKSLHQLSHINYLETSGITKTVITEVEKIFSHEEFPSRAKRIVAANDIVYSTVRPNQEHHGIVKEPLENMIVSTGFAVISHKQTPVFNDLIYQFLSSNYIVSYLQTIAESSVSAYPSINTDDILALKLAWPATEELVTKLSSRLGTINTTIYANQKQNQQLSNLRDWLLPMLMNGQVKVGEAVEALSMAAEPEAGYEKGPALHTPRF